MTGTHAIWVESGSTRFLMETTDGLIVDGAKPQEVASGIPAGLKGVADLGDVATRFERLKDVVTQIGKDFAQSIEKIPSPTKAKIEFGITLSGEGGMPMITKTKGEASIRIVIEWSKAVTTTE
jgi:NTP-dependent ternary system trypsin peptidase co-occuring protein